MNMMHGACFFACSNMSRTRDAPTPTNISTKSEPEIVKNGTFASPAMARASNVLPVSGRPDHQHAAGDLAAELLEFRGITQKVHEFSHFLLGFVDSGDVGERHLDLVLAQQARSALAERQRAPAARTALHLAHEEDPHADQQKHREPGNEYLHQQRLLLGRARHR